MTGPVTAGQGPGDNISVPEARRRREVALAGHGAGEARARSFLDDPSPRVRATALGALCRLGQARVSEVKAMLGDAEPLVRRRACEVAASLPDVDLVPHLDDADPSVVEAAAWALGERRASSRHSVEALAGVATQHTDALCREAAVAALGSIGHESGLAAILAATEDKPAVRRRAVIALAPFEGAEVDAALDRALADRDWQVRQAGEDLLNAAVAEDRRTN
ncbi:MAG: HEAT repeat domain-containing protein [Actinomycetota bacterium]|nr:HEAT repeat domain-containing protein [Actinomycetota bacterium]MDQ3679843.1 HEAT repeat domain-containing protein [Actinomycetota bacterium]